MGDGKVMGVDWKMVDLYGKMGISKIVRESEGKVGDEWGWERGVWCERVDLSGVKGVGKLGCFWKHKLYISAPMHLRCRCRGPDQPRHTFKVFWLYSPIPLTSSLTKL